LGGRREGGEAMNNVDMKNARKALGLSVNQMGAMLDTDGQSIRRMEMDPSNSTARSPAPRMIRLIVAYLDGYRPQDWPL